MTRCGLSLEWWRRPLLPTMACCGHDPDGCSCRPACRQCVAFLFSLLSDPQIELFIGVKCNSMLLT